MEGVAPSGSGRLVNLISKYKIIFKRKFSVSLNNLLCGKKLKFVRVGHGSGVNLRRDDFSEGAKVMAHLFWRSNCSRSERWIVPGGGHVISRRVRTSDGEWKSLCIMIGYSQPTRSQKGPPPKPRALK